MGLFSQRIRLGFSQRNQFFVRLVVVAGIGAVSVAPVQALTWNPDDPDGFDPFGSGCYDYPPNEWSASFGDGKGLLSEPLCILDPCEGALEREVLGHDIVGRPVTDSEWDLYYSRYAEFCRSETNGTTSLTGTPVSDLITVETPSDTPVATTRTPDPIGTGSTTSVVFVPTDETTIPPLSIPPTVIIEEPDVRTTTVTVDIEPIPLPATVWAFLMAFAALAFLRMVPARRSV